MNGFLSITYLTMQCIWRVPLLIQKYSIPVHWKGQKEKCKCSFTRVSYNNMSTQALPSITVGGMC